MASTQPKGRRSDGARTHAAILDAAARLASVEGIHGLTIGRLAESLGVSKSGLYAHFGSKERLQIETIEHAYAIFDREVMQQVNAAPPGLQRIRALCDAYFSYLERSVFPGGCFFASLLAEVDARPGPIRDIVENGERETLAAIASYVQDAQRLGEVDPTVDATQAAFEIDACLDLANYHFVLFGDVAVLDRGRRGVEAVIERISAKPRARKRRR